jgi:CarboxypepD_reg-like domain
MFRFTAILLFLCLVADAAAQSSLQGKIFDGKNDSLLAGVTIMNITGKKFVLSDRNGQYTISAAENDLLVFSFSGYAPDTIPVEPYMFYTRFDITLKPQPLELKGVTVVATNYQTDSLNRQAYYRHILSKREPGITGRNTPVGFGISLSPFSHFSRESKARRALKKRIAREEKESYIDHRFSPELVKRITKLDGDSLRLFMYANRPGYEFCRKASPEEMLLYISDCLKEFRKPVAKKPD